MAGVWTRNYTNYMASFLGGANLTADGGGATYSSNNLSVRTYDGNYHAFGSANFPGQFPYMSQITYRVPGRPYYTQPGGAIICFGTGDTAPTYDDYTIESGVSNFTVSQANVLVSKFVYDSEAHTYSTTYRFVCQYTGSSPVTLKEMVLGCQMWFSSDYRYDGIFYREVFDEPITVNQYESVVIELTQSFPLINYQPYPE